jgi:hypothetical protein
MKNICSKCKIHSCTRDTWCKNCRKEYNKNHYQNNKEYYRDLHKEYRNKNKGKVAKISKKYRDDTNYNQKYREKNKEILRVKKNEYLKKRYKNEPSFRIKVNIYQRISKSFKGGISNMLSNILPYSMEELKIFLEKQFEPWMNWNNYGKYKAKIWDDNNPTTWTWHIDHIIPHSKLKYQSVNDKNFRDCWALENLRPYPSKRNIKDGNRR